MKTKLFSLLIACLIGIASHAQQRIIGGTAVDISQRPYQAAIYINGKFNGGGVIINNQWILTAAHVVKDSIPDSGVSVSTGYTNLNNDHQRSTISDRIYRGSADFVLLKLSTPLTFSSTRAPINISQSTFYPSGTSATVSGWGRRMVNGDASTNQLYKTDVTISSCNDYYIYARPSTTSAYKGDSGGPLTISTNEGTQLIGIVEGGDENNPSLDEVSYVNIGVNRDWIARYASFYSISGSENVICNGSTATYSISAPGATIEVSPNLTIVSQTSSSVTVRGNVQGRGYVNIKAGNTTMAQKAVWVGAPIISGVTYNSGYLRVETLGGDAGITYTEWTIGSNLFTAYSSSIACPYSSGTFNVSVKARNSCGTSAAFNTQITIPSYYSYAATVDSEARSVTVDSEREADGASPMSAPASGTLRYALASLTTGQLAATGTLPAAGGTIDCANLPNGLYALKLFTPDGTEQAFKITLR